MVLDIGVVAARSGVAPSALRHYERVGLIRSVSRRGLRRQFDARVLSQLALISLGRAAGFSLTEIRGMFGHDGEPDLPRPVLRAKRDELDEQIRRLTTLKRVIGHVAECPASSHMECPKFRRLLRMVSHS